MEQGEFVLGSGEADLEPFDLAQPFFAFGFGDPSEKMSRISVMRGRWAGSERSMEQRTQACSWISKHGCGTVKTRCLPAPGPGARH
jgi:hypothetical protein